MHRLRVVLREESNVSRPNGRSVHVNDLVDLLLSELRRRLTCAVYAVTHLTPAMKGSR
jgi:hypothetical protein